MDIDDLKRAWQSQIMRIDKLEEQNKQLKERLLDKSLKSNRAKLLSTYRWLLLIGLLMVPFTIVSFSHLELSPIAVWTMVAYFLLMSVANVYVYYLIYDIDMTNHSVCDNLQRVINLQLKRHRIRIGSCILGIVIISIFFYYISQDDPSLVIGGIIGGIVGGLIGLRKEREIKAMISSMKKDLEDALSE